MKKYLLALVLAIIVATIPWPSTLAYEEGISFNTIPASSNKSPILTGSVPMSCQGQNVTIKLHQDDPSISNPRYNVHTYIATAYYGGDSFTSSWYYDLSAHKQVLENGHYHAVVSCGQTITNGGYTFQQNNKYFKNVLYVYPESCESSGLEDSCTPIYRFYNTNEGSHFYTSSENEKNQLMSRSIYRYEGISGFSADAPYEDSVAVHRFYNKKTGTHFYTSVQSEASRVNDTMYDIYRYEGVAFYVDRTQHLDSIPMYRFYKFNQGVHFYTAIQSEASNVNDTMYKTYRYEGISYYVIKNI